MYKKLNILITKENSEEFIETEYLFVISINFSDEYHKKLFIDKLNIFGSLAEINYEKIKKSYNNLHILDEFVDIENSNNCIFMFDLQYKNFSNKQLRTIIESLINNTNNIYYKII
jgi:hypothetical protein